jgi:hypothetical protein
MRITESQLRKIVRQEAQRLSEMGAGPGGFSYRAKLAKLRQSLDILLALNKDEYRLTGGGDADLERVIEVLDGYMGAVEVMADQEGTSSFSDPSRQAWRD